MSTMLSYIRRTPTFVLACKFAFIGGCMYMILSGRFPPSHAQSSAPNVYGLQLRSAEESVRIDGIASEIAEMKAEQLRTDEEMQSNTSAIASMSGEQVGIGVVLMLLQVGGMVFSAKRNKDRGGS